MQFWGYGVVVEHLPSMVSPWFHSLAPLEKKVGFFP